MPLADRLADESHPGRPRAGAGAGRTLGPAAGDRRRYGRGPEEPLEEFRASRWHGLTSRLHESERTALTWFPGIFAAMLAVVAIRYVMVGYPPSNAI